MVVAATAGARQLVRVLNGTGVPFVITTLSPEGAREAEEAGYLVLRGDSARQRTLERVGIERAKVMVIADDDAATASRITTVARMTNPTMRIVVRTRYLAEVDPLAEAGADRVLAEELEAVVQLFADVLREYRVEPEEIEAQEAAVRAGRYAALRAAELPPLPPCRWRATAWRRAPSPCARARRRRGAGWASSRWRLRLQVRGLRADGVWEEDPGDDAVLRPGVELALAGTAEAFARGAPSSAPRRRPPRPSRARAPAGDGGHGAGGHPRAGRPVAVRAPGAGAAGAPGEPRVRGVPAHGRRLGTPARLHELRPRRLLRRLQEPPRHRPLHRHRPPGDALDRARRDLGVVLRRQGGAVGTARSNKRKQNVSR